MLGWIILFALLSLLGAVPSVVGSVAAEASMRTCGFLFLLLLFATLAIRFVRVRA